LHRKFLTEIRLVIVVGLLLIPIGLLGWLFVHKSYSDVRFAQKELVGTEYLRAIFPIYGKLVNGEVPTSAQIKLLQNARSKFDAKLRTEKLSTEFEGEVNVSLINFSRAKNSARNLISAIGDQSNLILDPDLDTYYLMDVVLLRTPEILALSAQLTQVAASRLDVIDPIRVTQQKTQLSAQLQSTISGLSQSIDKAIDGNVSGTLRPVLTKELARFSDYKNTYLDSVGPAPRASAQNSASAAEAYDQHRAFTNATLAFTDQTMKQLERLLSARIGNFVRNMLYSVSFSLLLTLGAVALSITVLRRLLMKMDDKIIYLAHHDSMTRLKNRSAFHTEMISILATARQTNEQVALHLIDLDRFKSINDTMGHQTGDEVLKCLAERLLRNTRPSDVVGRLGGDEFVVLQRFVATEQAAKSFADRLVIAMREPMTISDQRVNSSISAGSAIFPIHASSHDTLMGFADMALYAAKAAGRDQTSLFTAQLEAEVQQRRRVEEEVKRAVAEDRFTLNFQAQYDANGKIIRGFEALLRLRSTTGQIIPPSVFIPVAEQLGLIQHIGTWVLNHACEVAAQWPKHISLAVNLSPLQFSTGGVAEVIAKALKKSGFEANRLQVEITEGILMENTEAVLAELTAIRALGASIVMDDFGTGYSSLGYLWRFPFDKIKIDRSFIKALESDDAGAQNILRTIVSLGHSLEMKVTAEGVETLAQADFMNELKCDEIQGFYYGRPAAEEDLSAIILSSFQKSIEVKHKTTRIKQVVRKSKS
jgi:diguanylate cyclase (GGDEF)-like protein